MTARLAPLVQWDAPDFGNRVHISSAGAQDAERVEADELGGEDS